MKERVCNSDPIQEILRVGKEMYRKGFVVANQGSISVRVAEDQFLLSASHLPMEERTEREIHRMDGSGNLVDGSEETTRLHRVHARIHQSRPDVTAVIYAHPPTAIGFTIAGVSFMDPVVPEMVIRLGGVPTVSSGVMVEDGGLKHLQHLLPFHDGFLLERLGAITLGDSVMDAWGKMELIEQVAQVRHTARTLGKERVLSTEEVDHILKEKRGGPSASVSKAKRIMLRRFTHTQEETIDIDELAIQSFFD
ncbi:class II aldolase/adducin family protein [Marininema halotolerans]|uniref:L-fuculose-phosphate aldolase n=1 Tax=Marininema halotolerans TaxID=1155944 RepID=A0A1I6NSD7_9BACL|nr:class II aldolase/adducin family protein [Marininema halotolerans]SFS30824.1 L-fuculose-phosphate aldolase [Marininema halotolerans]